MTTTYKWTISAIDCVPQENGKNDVVVMAHWNVSATDGAYSSSVYGTQSFTYAPKNPFTPYADLTQSQIVGWIQSEMGIDVVTELQENLDNQIANQINPPIVTLPLPWATN